jgi:hypothetical protein
MIPGQQLDSLVGDFDFDLGDVTCATALAQIDVLTMHAYSFHLSSVFSVTSSSTLMCTLL